MSERVSTTALREDLSGVLNRVAYGHERIVIERYGRDLVAFVTLEDLELLEKINEPHSSRPR